MKSQKTTLVSLALILGFLVLYVLLGFALWRLGFVPQDRSLNESVVIVAFLLFVVLVPLGLVSWLSLARAARKQAAAHNQEKAFELRQRATSTLVSNIVEFAMEGLDIIW